MFVTSPEAEPVWRAARAKLGPRYFLGRSALRKAAADAALTVAPDVKSIAHCQPPMRFEIAIAMTMAQRHGDKTRLADDPGKRTPVRLPSPADLQSEG
jgi:hypothetical protein